MTFAMISCKSSGTHKHPLKYIILYAILLDSLVSLVQENMFLKEKFEIVFHRLRQTALSE